ncbi:MAG: DUF1269 domain-containing protein [Thermoleophilia bacterium]|nr:DUF1269 domain-containing protein [Thermoleophilia bacterium]
MADLERFTFLAGTYQDVAAAEGDYELLKDLYRRSDLTRALDATLIGRRADARFAIHTPSVQPAHANVQRDAGCRLAYGLTVALFPAGAIGTVTWTPVTAAGIGAIAGVVSAALSRSDLKALGEHLDTSEAALIVAAATNAGDTVESAMARAEEVVTRQANIDSAALRRESTSNDRQWRFTH